MTKLFVYSQTAKDYYFFRSQINEHIQKEQNNFIVLLPVRRAVRYFRQQLIDAAPRRFLANPPVLTFDDLLLQLYQYLPGARRIINNDHFFLLLRAILTDHSEQFPYLLKNGLLTPGLIKKVSDMLSELRRFGYNSQNFTEIDPQEIKKNPLKFDDFERLLRLLEKYLGQRLIDQPYARHRAASLFTLDRLTQLFPEPQFFYISGYGLFTPAMFRFIEKATAFAQVHIHLDFNKNNHDLFSHVQPAVLRFSKMGAAFIEDSVSQTLSACLFNRSAKEAPPLKLRQQITVQPLTRRAEEVAFIAATIRQLHLKNHLPLSQIAVTFPNLERYVPLIRRIFSEYGLPFNLSTGFNLSQSPLIRLFLGALELVNTRFELLKTLSFFQSPFIPKKNIFDRALLQKFFTEQRFKYLTPGWYAKALKRLKAAHSKNPELLTQLNRLNEHMQILYRLPQKQSVRNLRLAYVTCLGQLGLLYWFQRGNAHLNERQRENEFRVYNRFMKLFEKVIWILDYLYAGQALSLSVFTEFLETAVNKAVYNLTEWPEYGVQVMPRLEVLALNPKVLFLGGLVDGEFPRARVNDVFFNDALREKMGLTAAEELLEQDRYIFYSLLTSSAGQMFFTYPRFEEERALVPSAFLSDLNEIILLHWVEDAPGDDFFLNESRLWLSLGRAIQFRTFDAAGSKAALLKGVSSAEALSALFHRILQDAARLSGTSFGEYEGHLGAFPTVVRDLRRRNARRSWSASRLEDYAFCPLSYFFKYLLKIEPAPEIEKEISPLERGLFVHTILEQFYRELAQKGAAGHPLAHQALLLRIAEEEFNRLPYRGLLWEMERALFFGIGNEAGLLQTFLEYDQQQIDQSAFIPALFEVGFGAKREQQPPLELQAGSVKFLLEGRIDRVDLNPKNQAFIFDYKTGTGKATLKPQHVLQGLHFQLPLYMLALRRLLPETQPLLAAFYIVKDVENCTRSELLADAQKLNLPPNKKEAWLPNKKVTDKSGSPLNLEDLLHYTLELSARKIAELNQGLFRHTRFPDKAACKTYCPYRRICQKNLAKILRAASVRPE